MTLKIEYAPLAHRIVEAFEQFQEYAGAYLVYKSHNSPEYEQNDLLRLELYQHHSNRSWHQQSHVSVL